MKGIIGFKKNVYDWQGKLAVSIREELDYIRSAHM